MLMLLLLQVDVVMERDNLGQGQVEQCLKSLGCRLINAEHDLDRREITGAVILNKEYEVGVEDHQGRELSMYEMPGMREVTGKNNPDGKHNEVNVVRERVNMSAREDRVDKDTVGHGDDDDYGETPVQEA
jgi:hypothetical protein